ncbi:MAG TPA: type II toxin-antitoxin system RelE/ParE family toxin [Thermoanaerobaculia bacterium]|nr:type II toxin-antitoxin system RelE/ParE family toxin [Thermoanaerobaculia bacterium]
MKVLWTENAISHLIAIYEYIARDSSFYAQRMVDRLTKRSRQLSDFPNSGRMVPEYSVADIREVVEKPYRLIYRVYPDRIEILAAIHGAQRLPPEF